MDTRTNRIAWLIPILAMAVFLSGCAHKPKVKEEPPAGSFLEDIFVTPNPSTDLVKFSDETPNYLQYIDSLIKPSADDDKLLCRVSGAYYGFAYTLMEDKDRKEASRLYLRGKDLALKELRYYRLFDQALTFKLSIDAFRQSLRDSFNKSKAPVVYWAAMNWTGWIYLNIKDPAAVQDIPRVIAMLEFVDSFDNSYENGSVHAALGILNCLQPKGEGGDPARAKGEFEKAFASSFSSTFVYHVMYAKYYAYRMRDRELFRQTLESVLDKPVDYYPDMNFLNEVAKNKARLLMKNIDKYYKQPSKKAAAAEGPGKAVEGEPGKKALAGAAPAAAAGGEALKDAVVGEAPAQAVQEKPAEVEAAKKVGLDGAQEKPAESEPAKDAGGEAGPAKSLEGEAAANNPAEGEPVKYSGGDDAPKDAAAAAGAASAAVAGEEASKNAVAGEAPKDAGVEAAQEKSAEGEAANNAGDEAVREKPVEEAPQNTGAEAVQEKPAEAAPAKEAEGEAAREAPAEAAPPEKTGADAAPGDSGKDEGVNYKGGDEGSISPAGGDVPLNKAAGQEASAKTGSAKVYETPVGEEVPMKPIVEKSVKKTKPKAKTIVKPK